MNIRNQIQHIRVGMINADRKLWIFFSRLCISRWFFSSGSIAITCGGAFPRSCKNVWNANEFSPQKAPQSTRQSFCSRFPHSAFLSWLFSLQCGKIRVRKFILICTTTVWKSLHRAECTKGRAVQEQYLAHIESERRNPILADLFHRMRYMARRGSGLQKIRLLGTF